MSINVYAVATPIVLALVLAEFTWCLVKKNGYYSFQDSIASMGTAVLNQCTNVAVALGVLPLFGELNRLSPWTLDASTPLGAIGLFLGVDFLFYWFHRFGHRTNIGWAAHSPHHSTEELNYAVALRASVTQRLFSFLFYWPLVVIGFSATSVVAMVAVHLLWQFVPHTRVVKKLPWWIESWMNTPSHHRVHHSRNDRYIDKNYAGFLVIWDKMFGTFEPEKEACSYGLTNPPNTWDPTVINFQAWAHLVSDAVAARSVWDKVRIWVMPSGWRPAGLPERPSTSWLRDGNEVKFRSSQVPGTSTYLVLQMIAAMPFMLLVSHHESPLTGWEKVTFTAELWAMATAWGGLLESKRWAMGLEALRVIAMGASAGLWLSRADIHSAFGPLALAWLGVSMLWLLKVQLGNQATVPRAVEEVSR